MLTATARKHIIRALRSALAIREIQAVLIIENDRNVWQIAGLDGDLRGIKALVYDKGAHGVASLFLDSGHGYEGTGVSLHVQNDDMLRWRRMPQDEAFAISAEIADNMYVPAVIDTPQDDDGDYMLDMGPIPESRQYDWHDGTVLSAAVAPSGDHVIAQVKMADGENKAMAMFPHFSDAAGLLSYVSGKLNRNARLCIGHVNIFDEDVPGGFDRSMPVLDMVIPEEDAVRIARSFRASNTSGFRRGTGFALAA